MSIDPRLHALFETADQASGRDAFVRSVMARVDRERRRLLLVWVVFAVFMIAALALLASPVLTAAGMAMQLLPVSLVDIESEWLRQLLAPINSVAALVAIAVLALRRFFRRILG